MEKLLSKNYKKVIKDLKALSKKELSLVKQEVHSLLDDDDVIYPERTLTKEDVLNGPTFSDEEYEMIKAVRKQSKKWKKITSY